MTAQTAHIVQKIATEASGHDLVVGLASGIKTLMKCQQSADKRVVVVEVVEKRDGLRLR
jgi:hypothetical protein